MLGTGHCQPAAATAAAAALRRAARRSACRSAPVCFRLHLPQHPLHQANAVSHLHARQKAFMASEVDHSPKIRSWMSQKPSTNVHHALSLLLLHTLLVLLIFVLVLRFVLPLCSSSCPPLLPSSSPLPSPPPTAQPFKHSPEKATHVAAQLLANNLKFRTAGRLTRQLQHGLLPA